MCNNLGEQFQWIPQQSIIEKCYYFDNETRPVDEAQDNCGGVFGPNMSGKLTEPATIDIYSKILAVSKEKLTDKEVLTGFKKTDDSG